MVHNKMSTTIAKLISRIFEPILIASIGFIIILDNINADLMFWLVNIFLLIFLPGIVYIYSAISGKDIEMKKRTSRNKLYLLASPLIIISAIYSFNVNFDFFKILLVVGTSFFVAAIINKKFLKISMHVMAITIFGLIIAYYQNSALVFAYFLPLIYIIGMARYVIKNHTIIEMVVGFLTPIIISITLLFIFRGINI